MCLFFYFYRELQDGTLKDNGLMDESKIILIPNVETGLLVRIVFTEFCLELMCQM